MSKVGKSQKKQQVTPQKKQQVTPQKKQQVTPQKKQQVTPQKQQQVTPQKQQQVTPQKQQQVTPQKKPGTTNRIKRVIGFGSLVLILFVVGYFFMKDRKEDTPTPQMESYEEVGTDNK